MTKKTKQTLQSLYLIWGKKTIFALGFLSLQKVLQVLWLFCFHKITPQPLNPTSLTQPTHTPPWSRGAVTDGGWCVLQRPPKSRQPNFTGRFWNNQGGLSLCAWGHVHFLILLWSLFFFVFILLNNLIVNWKIKENQRMKLTFEI